MSVQTFAQDQASLLACVEAAEEAVRSGQTDVAIAAYESWLGEHPGSALAWAAAFNQAGLLSAKGDLDAAEQRYRLAVSANPDHLESQLNLGLLLERRGDAESALGIWRALLQSAACKVEATRPLRQAALNHLGRLSEQMGRYDEAEQALGQSLLLSPDQAPVLHHWVHLRQRLCHWPVYPHIPGWSQERMRESTSALALLGLSDRVAEQRAAAERWISEKVDTKAQPLSKGRRQGHAKIRLGYLSSDLGLHAVGFLTVEMLERHDRSAFELYAFTWREPDGSAFEQRVLQAFDHVVDIRALSDAEAAEAIHARGIDVLIDLQGLTSGARPNILARRPAPVQLGYLGFPGPCSVPGVDYVLADRYVIPEPLASAYAEKPVYLPDCFQVSDTRRPVGMPRSRREYGLPDHGVVFCAFNNTHKVTEQVFAAWMQILAGVPGSVLWLLADHPKCREYLTEAAMGHGIAADRLYFAERLAPPDYLARYTVADLFLDTFPFNGGTTVNDALFMGLPVLTRSGEAFASRMAGSLLSCLGLPELITLDLDAYVRKAIELGNDPQSLAAVRTLLHERKSQSSLFDIAQRTRAIEAALCKLVKELPHEAPTARTVPARRLLHVGCGPADKRQTTPEFAQGEWQEIRVDIDPSVAPDVIASMTSMPQIADASVQAVYSSHSLEHLEAHQVGVALQEFCRVLSRDGILVLTCPDLAAVCRHILDAGPQAPAYLSAVGPISGLDMLYGHGAALAAGRGYMAHRTGFTAASLQQALKAAGFASAWVVEAPAGYFDLWAIAALAPQADLKGIAQAHFPALWRRCD